MSMIKIRDAEFYYELHGSGQPLVLVAGYSSDHRHWLPILDDLAKHFQVLIFDNRAIGQTRDDKNTPLSVESMADDTMALIEALGLKNPSVIGHSMGGTIVQNIAARYADKINKIGILQSASKWRKASLDGLASLISMRKANIGIDAIFAALFAWVFGEGFLRNQTRVEELKKLILADQFPQSIHDQERQFRVLEQFNSSAYLAKITVPTLIASGIEDLLSLPHNSKELAQNIVGSKLVSLNCGHNMILELPDETVAILLDFFSH